MKTMDDLRRQQAMQQSDVCFPFSLAFAQVRGSRPGQAKVVSPERK